VKGKNIREVCVRRTAELADLLNSRRNKKFRKYKVSTLALGFSTSDICMYIFSTHTGHIGAALIILFTFFNAELSHVLSCSTGYLLFLEPVIKRLSLVHTARTSDQVSGECASVCPCVRSLLSPRVM
jgi:hypothetical protein